MELIYFWIDGYKNLKNCGVCLNSNYDCKILECCETGLELEVIQIAELNNVFDKRFNIITIAGRNGSGKSNIINALSYTLREIEDVSSKFNTKNYDDSDLFDCKIILLFSDYNKQGSQNTLFYYTKNVTVRFSKGSLKFKDINVIKNNIHTISLTPQLPYSVAKFQPFLRVAEDNGVEFPLWNNIFKTTKIKLKEYFYYDRFRLYESVRNLLELFKFNEFLRQRGRDELEIFFEKNQHLFFDKYSPYLDVYEALQWANKRVQQLKEYNYNITQTVSRSISTLSSNAKRNKYKEVADLFNGVLPNLFFTYALGEILIILNKANISLKDKLEDLINKLSENNFPKQNERLEFYKSVQAIIVPNRVINMLQAYIDFEEQQELKNILKEKFEIVSGQNGTIIQLKKEYMVDIIDYDNLPEYVQKIEQLKSISKNLYKEEHGKIFDFMNLSTGEQRILKFIADVYLVANLKKIDKNTKTDTDVYIFDEMDLSWHPEWQRKMVFYILDVFKKVFANNKRKINIIFTTHSPFILSDMPQNNVIILEKDDNGTVISQRSAINTFATNIHELFKESFFMNSTMGEFAKNTIKSIINDIDEIESKIDFVNLEQKINIIGEPIIRNQLLKELYDKKYIEYCIEDEKELCKQLKLENNKLKNEIVQLKKSQNEKI